MALEPDSEPQQKVTLDRRPLDVGGLIEQLMVGALEFVAKLLRTLLWLTFRPISFGRRIQDADYGENFCYPIAFLVMGILCGHALISGAWTISEESRQLYSGNEMDWLSSIVNGFVGDLHSITIAGFLARTLPAAAATIALAVLASWMLGAQSRILNSHVVSAICLVIGYKLFLRFVLGCWQAVNVLLQSIPEGSPVASVAQVAVALSWIAYLLFLVYVVLLAGLPTLIRVLHSQIQPVWMRVLPIASVFAGMISAGIFVSVFLAPLSFWNAYQFYQLQRDDHLLLIYPMSPATLEYTREEETLIAAKLLLKSNSDQQLVLAFPDEILLDGLDSVVRCHYEFDGNLGGTCLVEPRNAKVVRAVWRLNPTQLSKVLNDDRVPLLVELGTTDQVLKEQIQGSSLDISLDTELSVDIKRSNPRLAEQVDAHNDNLYFLKKR